MPVYYYLLLLLNDLTRLPGYAHVCFTALFSLVTHNKNFWQSANTVLLYLIFF